MVKDVRVCKMKLWPFSLCFSVILAVLLAIALAYAGTSTITPSYVSAADYLAQHANKKGVHVTATGLQYEILSQGKGEVPLRTDIVTVHYQGQLVDGTVFDTSIDSGHPISFRLDQVIPGWTEGLQLMNVGSEYRFAVPPNLAYGSVGIPGLIPPDSVLIFDVKLEKIGF